MDIDFEHLYRKSSRFEKLPKLIEKAIPVNVRGYNLLYNIELIDNDSIRITLAVPGFIENDIDVEICNDNLIIWGRQIPDRGEYYYLYKSISTEDFEIHFKLSKDARVANVSLQHGLLGIDIERAAN